ncbi:endo-1,4-beta-xylanase [Ascochyta rabiei]|uniref:Endo-1,4-beta-xylanase n=1 Tax=Didymella rabiei TaxID=5454 RepID=A0A163GPB8_DIDRA|nr:endo-1,4-beta-xylanase [Ascochyta rabiei]
MVAFSHIAVALSAVVGSFAAPTANAVEDLPDFELTNVASLVRRQDYNQNYTTSGNVNFSPNSSGYSVSFSNAGDFVVGKGWSKGTTREINFSGSTSATAGTVLVSVYGWTQNPLVEYYIQEYTSNGAGSAQGTKVGSVTCDGSVYDIWKHTQVNQPSIVGTTTFTQYISNRQNKRPGSGTVTTKCHFDAWAKLGLNLGTHNYQTLSTEGWGNAGGNSNYTLTGS